MHRLPNIRSLANRCETGGGEGLLDPKLGIDCEPDRESSRDQPVKVAHTEVHWCRRAISI